MVKIFGILQAVIAVLLMIAILLQNRGTGMSAVLGGDFGGSYYTRRGVEKFLVRVTIVLAALFVLVSILHVSFSV